MSATLRLKITVSITPLGTQIMLKKIFAALTLCILLPACTGMRDDMAETRRYEDLSFTSQPPIKLKVNKIDIVSEFTPSFKRPNVEHLFPISIEKTARIWARDRLEAVDFSSKKVAKFIIKDASVTEEVISSNEMFSQDRVRYKARLIVTLRITDGDSLSAAETSIEAWRELTINANTDIDEKERYWNGMVDKLFNEFNRSMEANINQYLNMYVVGSSHIQEYN